MKTLVVFELIEKLLCCLVAFAIFLVDEELMFLQWNQGATPEHTHSYTLALFHCEWDTL